MQVTGVVYAESCHVRGVAQVVEPNVGLASLSSMRPRASLVETIPLGMEDLHIPGSESTADALVRLVHAAEETIDLTALYWSLRPDVESDEDMHGWTAEELVQRFGAGRGRELYAALESAASRGVRVRILESPGFDEMAVASESAVLRERYVDQVDLRVIRLEDWYGGGIMHQKLWIIDRRSMYLGSANNDWRSLSQVKEIGIVIEDAPELAADAENYFETWWTFAQIEPGNQNTVSFFDAQSHVNRRIPLWSLMVPPAHRAPHPLDRPEFRTPHGWDDPLSVHLNGQHGEFVLSGAPREVCVGNRVFDGDLLVDTILDATTTVCINVMDFAPVSIYDPTDVRSPAEAGGNDSRSSPVWWPNLVDALMHAIATKRVHARLLVSEWSHTSPFVAPFLEALAACAQAASSNPRMAAGALEVRRFRVPGWDSTGPKVDGRSVIYPGHTRVNHVKYVVTDRRINIGTSNMTWDYFSATAGTSVNVTHVGLIQDLQRRFDRDWNSAYALPVTETRGRVAQL